MLRRLVILFVTVVKVSHSFSDVGKWDLQLSGVRAQSSSFNKILAHINFKF